MNIKKILLSLVAGAVVAGAMSVATLAAGDTTEDDVNAVARIGEEYYTTVDKAMTDAVALTDDDVTIYILKDVTNLPAPKRADLTFEAATAGIKVTGRANLPNPNNSSVVTEGEFTWKGFDFTSMTDWAFCPWDANNIAGLDFVLEDCSFGVKAFGAWEALDRYSFNSLTVIGCDFVSSKNQNIFSIQHGGDVLIKNCDFTECTGTSAVINMAAYSGDLTLIGNDFGTSYVQIAQNCGNYPRNLTVTECTFEGTKAVNLHSNFTNSSIDFDEVTFVENTLGGITSAFMVAEGVDFQNVFEDAEVTFEDNATADGAEVEDFIVPANAVAKIGNTFYATLQEAIDAATTGDVIDLMGNTIAIKDIPAIAPNNVRWFNTDGKTLTVKNGTFDLTGANVSDSVFRFTAADTHIAFENVDFVKEDDAYINYFFNLHHADTSVSFTKCTFDIAMVSSSFIANNAGGVIALTDCEVENFGAGNFLYRGNATVENVTFISETGNFLNHNAYPTTISKSTIVTKRLGVIAAEGTIAIVNGTSIKAKEVAPYKDLDVENNTITVDATSSLEADSIDSGIINTGASEGTIISKADSIEVQFVKVDEEVVNGEKVDTAEGEDLYNINLVGSNEEIINRLNSADLTFKLTPEHDMAYTIIASNKEVVINHVNNSADRYEFHYNGKDGVKTDVANVITIGQVKFEGYGKYDFEIVADAPNAAHATTISDNIVDTFIPNGDNGVQNGELIISNKIDDAYIAVPTRNLKINIDFPNSVEEQKIAYNDMKVVVSGGDLEEAITIELGSDAVETKVVTENDKATAKYVADFVEGAYVVEITDVLTVNTSYNVEVSGAGYRTARYTVTMNCEKSKTLNFWNNVKDNKVEVEEGKDTSKKNITFLAGDIVKDSVINIYDLSAVVSYFGEIDLDEDNKPEYAKYDLNRDGKIDSKDVAYVLVSWGK